jgi:protein-L-isoaspartate O-methyltransferase
MSQPPTLLSEAGRALVDQFFPYHPARVMAASQAARVNHGADLVAAAMTQAKLRTRAVERLGPQAQHLWFTADGLEQATRPTVAALRAAHFVASGAHRIADLGCGVGFDAIAFAQAGLSVVAVERDETTAEYARANVAELGLSESVEVLTTDAVSFDALAHGCDATFVDPARRLNGQRVKNPAQWSPSWSDALRLATSTPMGCLKVAPGIDHALPPLGATTSWISDGGDLVEACVWLGATATDQVAREAIVLPSRQSANSHALQPASVGPISAYLLEPDDAVIRAGLVQPISDLVGGTLIDPAIAYVTCASEPVASPLYSRFAVVEHLPFSLKTVRHRIRDLGVGTLEVKKRGFAVDPGKFRHDMRLEKGATQSLTVLLTRIGSDPVAIIAKRLP